MKVILIIFLFSFNYFNTIAAKEGGEVGNGGQGVYCQFTNDHSPKLYFLDYALMKNTQLFELKSYESSTLFMTEFIEHLKQTLPSLYYSFKTFLSIYQQGHGLFTPDQYIIWNSSSPQEIQETNLRGQLPNECFLEDKIFTIFKRYIDLSQYPETPSVITFYKDLTLIEKLAQNKEQFSWGIIHEWLWDFVDTRHMILYLNAFFHSSTFFNSSSQEIISTLKMFHFKTEKNFISRETVHNAFNYIQSYKSELLQYLQFAKKHEDSHDLCTLSSPAYQNLRAIAKIIQFENATYLKDALMLVLKDESLIEDIDDSSALLKMYKAGLVYNKMLQDCN